MAKLIVAVLAAVFAAPAHAGEAPAFAFPAACALGVTCFVQNYFDHDPGPATADFTCGSLTYDGHDGTDIRLPNYVAMAGGVAVLAAADGVVLRTRDGMADVSVGQTGAAAVAGKEAGNAVIIDHGDGWQTQYSHLRQGSIAVEPGQPVSAGDALGLVGLSGNTEFPHLEFVVRQADVAVDPFVGTEAGWTCGGARSPLWADAGGLVYVPGGLLSAGYATGEPDPEQARRGAYVAGVVAADAAALVFWVDVFGTRDGDVEILRILGPDGAPVVEISDRHDRNRAQWFKFAGRKRPDGGWATGVYVGTYELSRVVNGAPWTIISTRRELQVR